MYMSLSILSRERRRSGDRYQAFTLIELLVVISLISLLISILLPALAASRRAGLLTQCSSSMRQIGLAQAMYTTEYKEYYPPGYHFPQPVEYGTGTQWPASWLDRYTNVRFPWKASNGLWVCAEYRDQNPSVGGTFSASMAYSSYTYNMRLGQYNKTTGVFTYGPVRERDILRASRKIWLVDGMYNTGAVTVYATAGIGFWNALSRHVGFRSNVAYFDQHVNTVSLADPGGTTARTSFSTSYWETITGP